MKDYYSMFVELSLQLCTKNDYSDRKKVKAHNVAAGKLWQLQNEMKRDCSQDTLCMLLSHEDDRVKTNAAALCIQMNTCVERACSVLKSIIECSSDSTIRFSAERLLKTI